MAWTTPRTWTDGELVTKAIMDPHVRDNFNAIGPHYRIRKPTTESVTSSAVLQDDNDFVFAIAASEVWQFDIWGGLTCGATGGFQYTFTVPASATGTWSDHILTPALFNFGLAFAATDSFASAVTSDPFHLSGLVVNAATPGNVTFRWAQAVSNGTATSVLADSWLIAHRVG